MQTLAQQIESAFRAAIQAALGVEAAPAVAVSADPKFGDYQSNAAMGLAKRLSEGGARVNPRDVAGRIAQAVDLGAMVEELSIAGPGFINVRLSPSWMAGQLERLRGDPRLGVDPLAPVRVILDYPSPNIAKEMHIGHLRPAAIGDALARVLQFAGCDVVRQNHIGDWGTSFGMLLAYLKETAGQADAPIADIEQLYRSAKARFDASPAFAEESRQCVVRLQAGAEEEMARWRRILEISRAHMDEMFALLGLTITRADERGESFYNAMLADVVHALRDAGVAVESEGALVVWVEGFEAPLIIRKRDGGFGYAATDLAALRFRTATLGGKRLIYVTDARQLQHFRQFSSAAARAGWLDGAQFEHVTFGTILGADNKPLRTKSGENVKLRDVLNEAIERAAAIVEQKQGELDPGARAGIARAVGIGSVKYFDLARDRGGDYRFDWEQMLAMDGNTAPYLQYAHARIRSIFRKAEPAEPGTIDLATAPERALGLHILRMGEVVQQVVRELRPHHLCGYLYELATRFSGFYETCPVLQSEPRVRAGRLALCDLTARTLALGLDLLGIEHPDQM